MVGATISYSTPVTDANGDGTQVTFSSGPAFLSFTPNVLTNGSTTTAAQAGNYSVAMEVCDVWNACTVSSFELWID